MHHTIKTIAEKCGVSVPTVSQVLNNTGKISQKTRARVLAVCQRLGYRPKLSAKVMRTGRFGTYTFLISNKKHASNFPMPLFEGINEEISSRGLLLNVVRTNVEKLFDEKSVPKFLSEWSSDGLLVNLVNIPKETVELIRKYRIPSIWLNAKQDFDSIYPDDFSGSGIAVEYLKTLGHTRIAYADYTHRHPDKNGHYSSRDRWGGYESAMKKSKLQPVYLGIKNNIPRGERIEFTNSWFSRKDRPTAVICYGTSTAYPIMIAVLKSKNIRIPEDLSLISFEGDDATGIRITGLSYDYFETGKKSVDMLARKIESPNKRIESLAMPYSLVAGSTTAAL
jgi:LacI family transcriptional regulator